MRDPDALAFYDALPPAEQAALNAALAEQPALAEAFARWQSLRASVRADLARSLPDRALLVLYALADDDLLSVAEREQVEAARPALDAALAKHPGLVAAVRRIRADRDAFDAAWADAAAAPGTDHGPRTTDHASASAPRSTPPLRAVRLDRARAADRPPRAAVRPMRLAFRIAAVVAVVAFAGVLTMLALRDAGWETVAGAQTVTFADGSTAELADGARLSLPADGADDARQARLLAGRALFRIERDPSNPFEVTTPNADIAVLGTTFSVEASDVQTEVVLVSGAVTLAPRATPDAAVRLAPGQRSAVLALDAPTAPAPADLGALAWTGVVFARGESVATIAARLGDVFGTRVTVAPSLAGEPVAGEFGADGLDDAVAKLALALGGRVEANGTGLRIVE